jgi:macrolide transport system ATP-binding/permease protein
MTDADVSHEVSKLARAIVALCAPLVPADRRDNWRRQWDADLICQAAWLVEQGKTPAAARRDLLRRSTGAFRHAALLRLRLWRNLMIGQDIKFAWRNIRRRPGFTLAIVLTLGLGVGANATIFSWLDAVVLSPLPAVPRASELALLKFATQTRNNLSFSYFNYRDVRDSRPQGLKSLAVYDMMPIGMRTTGEPERIWSEAVSGNFFEVLEVPAARGRVFSAADEAAIGASPVAVISDRLWRARFGASEAVIGSPISLNGHAFTVVGVTPPGFVGAMPGLAVDMYVPVTMLPALTGRDNISTRNNNFLTAIGRRDLSVTPATLKAAVEGVAARLAADHNIPERETLRVAELREEGAGEVLFPVLSIVMVVVGIVLVIACANVSSLLLSRAVARQREVTIRTALGASRFHLVRQLLIESLCLSALGGIAGVGIATWTSRSLGALLPPLPYPVLISASVNPRVLLFSAAVVVLATVVFGLMPAIQGSRASLQDTLRVAGSVGTNVRRTRLRRMLVAGQIALATVLLVCAGLFVRTLAQAGSADVGFSERNAVLVSFDLSSVGYKADKGREFYTSLLSTLEALPEVKSATLTTQVPLSIGGSSDTSPIIDGYTPKPNEDVVVFYSMVGPKYFETFGIPIVEGRSIDDHDRDGQQMTVVIGETMAKRYWPGRSAVGGRLRTGDDWRTVVGVAKDGKYKSLNEKPISVMYFPIQQIYRADPELVVATRGSAGAAAATIRRAINGIAPELALYDVRTMEDHLRMSVTIPRLGAILLAVFGGLALVLAAVGLYGVVAFAVSQRRREIGVRMALGAGRATILRQIIGEAAWTSGIGLFIGIALALAASPALSSLMVNISSKDPATYATTVAVLLTVTLVASWLPARRAANVDPVEALRIE